MIDSTLGDNFYYQRSGTPKLAVHGGFDADDYNKYTTVIWGVVPQMLSAYEENPRVGADDYNIPESGNGIPDLLDEIKKMYAKNTLSM